MKDHVIIVAGGSGSRMRAAMPKQFLDLCGKPVLAHTLEVFHRAHPTAGLIVVMHPEYVEFWKDLSLTLKLSVPHQLIAGGEERFHSVQNGLLSIADESGIVAVHDAVRPLVNVHTIETCFHVAREKGNAVPVQPITDSVRIVEGDRSYMADRQRFRIVQTPQCFEVNLLRRAYQQPFEPGFTDDASVVERLGEAIHLVEGNRENFKITTPEDLHMAEALITSAQPRPEV